MSISRLGHFLRVAAASGLAAATEAVTTSPFAHVVWAPAALLALRWIADELGGRSVDG